jgi:glycosyltransferase involved in cell wall biosynthesis
MKNSQATKLNPACAMKVLIVFNAGAVVYGMERGVIDTFDMLRPEVEPHFLMSYTTKRLDLPILKEIKERGLSHSFFSDWIDWPRIGKPKSLREVWAMAVAMIRGNRDVLKAARKKDFIYLPGLNYFYFSLLAAFLHRLRRRRILYHFHDLILQRSFRLRLLTLFVTDFIHCSNLGMTLVAKENPCILKRQNHVLFLRTASPRNIEKQARVNGEFSGKKNLLFFGQVSRHKGVDILLHAFEQIAPDYPDAVLHIAGAYPDANFKRECTRFIAQEHLKDRIKYWGYLEDIERLLNLAYIHVHPSPPSRFMDTFPLAALEAMSKGLPTVCFKSGGLPEMILDGQTGIVCESESVESLALGLQTLLKNGELRNSFSRQAGAQYQKLYSEAAVRRGWLTLLSL